ncbi:MAG TPA: hypothetical protein VFR87_10105 [Nocardioidaceae bacterium]|nr:hypothetical protein [Nocardioidaceae bacterium]
MREILGWMVEQLCRPIDTKVCAISNLTDDEADGFPGYYISA